MNANPSDPTTEGGGGGLSAGTLRALIGSGVVLIIAVVAFFIWRGVEADAKGTGAPGDLRQHPLLHPLFDGAPPVLAYPAGMLAPEADHVENALGHTQAQPDTAGQRRRPRAVTGRSRPGSQRPAGLSVSPHARSPCPIPDA